MAKIPSPFAVPVPMGAPPASWRAKQIGAFQEHAAAVHDAVATVEPRDRLSDHKLLIVALMEGLAELREEFDREDKTGNLRKLYERFRCELQVCGFPVSFPFRRDRAWGHRRLGEMAEARGDVVSAIWHYDLALRSYRDVGCRRRRDQLVRESER